MFQVDDTYLIFTAIVLSRFNKTVLMSFDGLKFFNVVVGAKVSEQHLQNVTFGSINKQTKIDSK